MVEVVVAVGHLVEVFVGKVLNSNFVFTFHRWLWGRTRSPTIALSTNIYVSARMGEAQSLLQTTTDCSTSMMVVVCVWLLVQHGPGFSPPLRGLPPWWARLYPATCAHGFYVYPSRSVHHLRNGCALCRPIESIHFNGAEVCRSQNRQGDVDSSVTNHLW